MKILALAAKNIQVNLIFLARLFVSLLINHEDTCARCKKYSSELDISRSLIRIFAVDNKGCMKKLNIFELDRMQLDEYREVDKIPFIVVLDNVRSLHNVGSVFRTSDAYRVQSIFLCGVTATPPSPEIHKTALGAEDSVSWQYFKDTREAVQMLHDEGYIVLSIEQVQGSTMLQDLKLDRAKRYAVIFGNEVKGVQQEVVDMSDGCIELPQYGTKHSLNVSVTAGIVIWEFARQLLIE